MFCRKNILLELFAAQTKNANSSSELMLTISYWPRSDADRSYMDHTFSSEFLLLKTFLNILVTKNHR